MARIPSTNDLYYIIGHWTRQIDVCSYFERICAICIVCIPVKAQICFDEWKYFKNWHVVMEAASRDGFIPYPTEDMITALNTKSAPLWQSRGLVHQRGWKLS